MKRMYMTGLFMGVILIGVLLRLELVSAENISYSLGVESQILEDDSLEKYNKLLRAWAYDENKIDDVHAGFPNYYGGSVYQ